MLGSKENTGDGSLPGVSRRRTEGGHGSRRMAGHQTENSWAISATAAARREIEREKKNDTYIFIYLYKKKKKKKNLVLVL